MKRRIITTADGSKTIQIEDWNEQYHSVHGAINEAKHVFIKYGLQHVFNSYKSKDDSHPISLLEIGFGTGLNAFLTLLETEKAQHPINYVGVEAYPVSPQEIEALNYVELVAPAQTNLFNKLHHIAWNSPYDLTNFFKLTKRQMYFKELSDVNAYDLVYFDAFGARVQPELWTEEVFKSMFKALKPNGVLVTYAAKGSVRRAMQAVGFIVERLDGPPGKREMLRATKSL